jgi:hypothetical protein
MIVYHNNNEIDREQWDNCIRNTPGARVYGYSWYLDIMAPGWQALVDDDYDSVFPVPGANRYGFKYISTPKYLQQLGAYSPDKPVSKAIAEFLEYMPVFYRYIDLCVGQKTEVNGYSVFEKVNLELELAENYDTLFSNFSDSCKKNIQSSSKHKYELITDIKPDEIINLLVASSNHGDDRMRDGDYQRLKNLVNFCVINRKGKIIGIRGPRKKLSAGLFLIEIQGRKTILFLAATPHGCEKGMDFFMINELIKNHASTKNVLDFADSSNPGRTMFFNSFGCKTSPYYRIFRNTLPWPLRLIKQNN